jgi:hypothetical protein
MNSVNISMKMISNLKKLKEKAILSIIIIIYFYY